MTDDDLTSIVDYQRSQQRLSNHAMGGWGVYSGYDLSVDPRTCCLQVGPGVAYDSCGRALLHCGTALKPPSPELPCPDGSRPRSASEDGSRTLWLAAAYDDCFDEPRPRLNTPCGPNGDPGCDYARVQERVRFVWLDEEPPIEYWTSGCLPDPCAPEPPPPDKDCFKKWDGADEACLDRCTPDVGVRGGVGVLRYRHALLERWNLRRNASLAGSGETDAQCDSGLGSILDVIGGLACPPCEGDSLVVLAKVTFGPTEVPSIKVEPLRRRVLSNADLTYLMLWLMEEVVCTPEPIGFEVEDCPPLDTVECEGGRSGDLVESAEEIVAKVSERIGRLNVQQKEDALEKTFFLIAKAEKGVRELRASSFVTKLNVVFEGRLPAAERDEMIFGYVRRITTEGADGDDEPVKKAKKAKKKSGGR